MAPSIPIPIPRRKKLATEPAFEHPPVWNHASVAEKCFLAAERAPLALTRPIEAGTARAGKQQIERKSVPSKREAKRRALLDLLDRIPVRAADTPRVQKRAGKTTPPMEIPLPAKAPLQQPLRGK